MYFDKKTIKVLKYIYKCGGHGAEWSNIFKKFKYATPYMLLTLNADLYALAYYKNGIAVPFDSKNIELKNDIRSYCTPKGNQLLEERSFNFWKWVIPTFISVISLCLSIITLLFTLYGDSVVKVMLLK